MILGSPNSEYLYDDSDHSDKDHFTDGVIKEKMDNTTNESCLNQESNNDTKLDNKQIEEKEKKDCESDTDHDYTRSEDENYQSYLEDDEFIDSENEDDTILSVGSE
ncbi:hypothetical protein PPL_06013 [Heterostelium album PN500]|uniref:Uncharacterized protein n=1 Tax=Heterostelium pallidum (strain ATCC 26659 / Pp 5 / PN500) TaxID=670386 RepID=D3BBZ3_HETP5|nr:hypothetical protein PPL_06013 [Heterostelium album PN500]EFA81176.1 hypothetical protein PPL_06013 [Heterostelium album PN500]|eukprot:XP_020433294.1 hypothetical protein PPL_06013 [Heterostelium album PN500]